MSVTLKDIASRLKVTEQTVSRSLNGYSNISMSTRRRVRQVARELGYRPNLQARRLRVQRTQTIGLLFPDISFSYAQDITRGIRTVLLPHGYHPLIGLASWDHTDESREIDYLLDCRVEALICQPMVGSESTYQRVVEAGIPLVFVGNGLEVDGTGWVGLDGYDAGRTMMSHLLGLGHQHIAFVATDTTQKSLSLGPIRQAYCDAMREAGLDVKAGWLCESSLGKPQSIEQVASSLMSLNARPTAIFAVSDYIAYMLMAALTRQDIRVPQDVSVAGMGNLIVSSLDMISLTTINEDAVRLGEIAAYNVLERLQHPGRSLPGKTIKGALVPRRSTARPCVAAHGG